MYGKQGRGGGKRSLPPPAPPGQRARHSLGFPGPSQARRTLGMSPRDEKGGGVAEESFKMVSADALDFAAIIRLTPDLVEEIKRLEAQGCEARIKFDANSNDLSGNVIDVGGKEFRFTWSRELGVCDIYEECQNGEDGNGLLSECGTAWRKLNVQRILDESLKNHVKMRSEEAERQHKSRKSIVLDPANPSVKNQAKTLAAAALEGNMRRMHWKKDQFKKRKLDTVASTIPPKPVFRSGTPSHVSSGSLPSTSPQPSPPGHVATMASHSFVAMSTNPLKSDEHAVVASNVESMSSEREILNKSGHGSTSRKSVSSKGIAASQPSDLRSHLISLLMANPKGMSLKALEKSVGETIPSSGKKIESIIKSIATYQAPGRYLLKPGIDPDISRKPPSRTMSPNLQPGTMSVLEEIERDSIQEVEHKIQLPDVAELDNENLDIEKMEAEKIDIMKYSPVVPAVNLKFNDKEQGACSSSESGSESDSESDSSDSESDSQSPSQSKSKSQSSDSESGESSSGKEGSDMDVDIMTSDDDKGQTGRQALTISEPVVEENHKEYAPGRADSVIEKKSLSDQGFHLTGIDYLVAEDTEKKPKDEIVKGSRDSGEVHKQSEPGSMAHRGPTSADLQLNGKVNTNVEKTSKDRKQRVSSLKHFQEGPGSNRTPWGSSPGNPKGKKKLASSDIDFVEDTFDSRRSSDKCIQVNTSYLRNSVGRSIKQSENSYEKSLVSSKDKTSKDIQDVIMDVNEKYSTGEEERGFLSVDQRESQKDTKSVLPLRRELSELELGEFREPKTSASRVNVMDNFSLESKKGRTPVKPSAEAKKESPYLSKCVSQPSQQVHARRILESESTAVSSQFYNHQRTEGHENDPMMAQELRHKRAASSSSVQSDAKQNGFHVPPKAYTDGQPDISNGLRVSSNGSKESIRIESINSTGQKVDFSSDEDESFYIKYDKVEPLLRGPVKDYAQYKEYIEEFREKYDCYSSLNKHLEKYRNEFLKVGRDLEISKGIDKDAYRIISEKIMQMYHQCRKKHSRMKKIFVLLHAELKVLKQRIKEFAEECSGN